MRSAILALLCFALGCTVSREVPPSEMEVRTRAYESRATARKDRAYTPSKDRQLRVKTFKSTVVVDDADHKPFVSRAKERLDRVFAKPEANNSSNPFLAPWNGVEKTKDDK